MSLTSRLTTYLSPGSPSALLSPENDEALGNDGGYGHLGDDFEVERESKRRRTMINVIEQEDLEMKRPPYLHVRPTQQSGRSQLTYCRRC